MSILAASVRLAAGLVALVACVSPMQAEPAPDFSGRTVTIIASFEAGGPYDFYARLVARHLGAYLPGKPNVIVQNMPGAGGLRGANYLYNVAPKDGTVMGVVSQTVAVGQVLGTTPGIQYDAPQIHLDRSRERQCRGRSRLARLGHAKHPGRDGARDDRRRHRTDLVVSGDAPADERACRYQVQDRDGVPGPDLGAARLRARRGRRHREALVEHQERHAGVVARQEDYLLVQFTRRVIANCRTCRPSSISPGTTSSGRS